MWTKATFVQRAKALSIACLSSAAVSLCILSGFNCSFLTISAEPGQYLATSSGFEVPGLESTNLGLMCDSMLFDQSDADGGDEMKHLASLFFHISLAIGGATTILAWTLSLIIPPRKCSWYTMAILGSVTAVLQVPMFLLANTDLCIGDSNRQSCSIGMGGYFNIFSILVWGAQTLWSQYIDPPRWDESEENRTSSRRRDPVTIKEIVIPASDTAETSHGSSGDGSNTDKNGSKKKNKQTKKTSPASCERDIESGLTGVTTSKKKKKSKQQPKEAPLPMVVVNSDEVSDMSSCPGQLGKAVPKEHDPSVEVSAKPTTMKS